MAASLSNLALLPSQSPRDLHPSKSSTTFAIDPARLVER